MSESKCPISVRGTLLGDSMASDLMVEDGHVEVVKAASGSKADVGSPTTIIAPTLFDIQVNGAFGIDIQSEDVTPDDVRALTDALAAKGVSRWIPTLISGSPESVLHGCRVLAEAMKNKGIARAIPGVHLEGPYISAEDGPRGAHNRMYIRKPDIREFDRLLKAAEGKIAYITVAPEVDGAVTFIKAVTKRHVVVALGHHNATVEQVDRAVAAGARLATHLGNGMAPLVHRHLNPIWAQLANDGLMASLIADLDHLPPHLLKMFIRAKGPQKIILTSDTVMLAGMKPGAYKLMGMDVDLNGTGRIALTGTELLAGSSLMLLQGVVNVAWATDLTLEQAFACATSIPARLFGLKGGLRRPSVGKRANFIAFDLEERPGKSPQGPYSGGVRQREADSLISPLGYSSATPAEAGPPRGALWPRIQMELASVRTPARRERSPVI